MPRDSGYTLVELLVALAVAAILVTVAVPGFAGLLAEQRVITTTNRFISALNLARTEAIRRGGRVTLCASADGMTCGPADGYGDGWLVVDGPAPGRPLASVTEILRVFEPTGGIAVEGNGSMATYVSFMPTGEPRQIGGARQMGTVTVCGGSRGRRVVISRTGRPRVETGPC
jgi:type IV fimbrial biogenesis protein FimT